MVNAAGISPVKAVLSEESGQGAFCASTRRKISAGLDILEIRRILYTTLNKKEAAAWRCKR